MDDCKQLSELYEAYALGALEGQEREDIERHLARGCPNCTAGVAQARWIVAQLAYLAPEAKPSADLRRRIVAAAVASAPAPADARATPIDVKRAARAPQRRPSAIPAWGWTIAAALLIATIYSTYQTRQLDRQLAAASHDLRQGQAQRAAIESERQHYEMAMEILSARDTKTLALMPNKSQATMPPVQAYWSPKMGLLVMSANMPQMPSSMTLQLWMVPKAGKPMSVGIFRPDGKGHVMMVAAPNEPMTEVAALAISEEPAGGSPQPTATPVWVGPLT